MSTGSGGPSPEPAPPHRPTRRAQTRPAPPPSAVPFASNPPLEILLTSTLERVRLRPEHRSAKGELRIRGQSSPCSPEPDPEPDESLGPLPESFEPEES